jgi:hypothetical protein
MLRGANIFTVTLSEKMYLYLGYILKAGVVIGRYAPHLNSLQCGLSSTKFWSWNMKTATTF